MKSRTHLPNATASSTPRFVSKEMAKQEFGRRVYNAMLEKGLNQSDLARAADMPRNNISTYVRGRSLPEPESLKRLAKSLGKKPEDLLPDYIERAVDADMPALEMKISPGDPGKAWLRVNQFVPVQLAVKIIGMLNDISSDRN